MAQDDLFSRKKAWKAFQADFDYVFSLSDRVCSYCLTDQQVAAMLVMTEYLKWPTRWVKSSGDIDPAIILNFSSGLESNLMSGCCDDNIPIQYRYSSTGVLQRSLNGGGVWEDAPIYDPRNYSPVFPPPAGADGDDKKCIAATGAAALVKEQIGGQLTDDMSRYTLAQLIKDWVATMLESSNPFQALVTVTANQIFALVISVLIPSLTDDVYDTFRCALYCNMSADATFTDAQWTAVRTYITDHISGIAGVFLEHLVYLLGKGGLTNLARAGGATTGDCSDCPDCGVPIVTFWTPALGFFLPTPISETDDTKTYRITSSDGSGENRIDVYGGVNTDHLPHVCVWLSFVDVAVGYTYRTTYDCDGIPSGSHGTPVPDGNYDIAVMTRNVGTNFVVDITVHTGMMP